MIRQRSSYSAYGSRPGTRRTCDPELAKIAGDGGADVRYVLQADDPTDGLRQVFRLFAIVSFPRRSSALTAASHFNAELFG
jgi:hypothetical protein